MLQLASMIQSAAAITQIPLRHILHKLSCWLIFYVASPWYDYLFCENSSMFFLTTYTSICLWISHKRFRSDRNMLNQSITSATGYFTWPHAVLMFSSLIPGRCGYAIKTPNNFPTVAKVYRGQEAHYMSECTKFEGFILYFEAINTEK